MTRTDTLYCTEGTADKQYTLTMDAAGMIRGKTLQGGRKMNDNETKLTARLREAAAAFSRIAGLLDGTVPATRTEGGYFMPRSEAREVAQGWQRLCEEGGTIAEGRDIDTGKVMQAAVELLLAAGINAIYEHPGYIAIPYAGGSANFGDVNGDYTAEWAQPNGDVSTEHPSQKMCADTWSLPRNVTAEQLAASIKTWFICASYSWK
jgi:hypothetical protein